MAASDRRAPRSRTPGSRAWRYARRPRWMRSTYARASRERSRPSRRASASVTTRRKRSPALRSTESSAGTARTASGAMVVVRAASSMRSAMRRARSSAGYEVVPRTRKSVSPSRTTGAVTWAISASGPAPPAAGGAPGPWATTGAAERHRMPSTDASTRAIPDRSASRADMCFSFDGIARGRSGQPKSSATRKESWGRASEVRVSDVAQVRVLRYIPVPASGSERISTTRASRLTIQYSGIPARA